VDLEDVRPATVLFVCVHNAGRSQMAAGWLDHAANGRIQVRSAGSEPADQINPVAVEAMREVGIDITAQQPKILTIDAVESADVVITMGCGDTCPIFPGKRYQDWDLTDPAGQPIEVVRQIRDQIKAHVQTLVTDLLGLRSPSARSVLMPGASDQTRQVKVLNANWTPGSNGEDGTFEILLITDDDQHFSSGVSASALTALVTIARADTVLMWDPTDSTLIAANIVGEMPWTKRFTSPSNNNPT
jgi:arsenate reductase (thioredoxin)